MPSEKFTRTLLRRIVSINYNSDNNPKTLNADGMIVQVKNGFVTIKDENYDSIIIKIDDINKIKIKSK